MKYSVEAYLDNFGVINVYIDYQFYNGKTDRFYLKDGSNNYYECLIRHVENHPTFTKYELVIPTDYRFDEEYILTESHGYSCPVCVRHIVQTKTFNELFHYDGNDLGATYTKEATIFKVFAPTAIAVDVEIMVDNKKIILSMIREKSGVYQKEVRMDLKNASYVYLVSVNGKINRAIDPYAYSSTANGKASAIIDLSLFDKKHYTLQPLDQSTDAIIYECSVRDFTHHKNTNTSTHSLYTSFVEQGTSYKGMPTGLDYIKSLGISHVQLMPVFDFATVDEIFPNSIYNWGYDPLQFGVLEGSYASNPGDPYIRIHEFKNLVDTLHSHNIRVNLDVVFNHHYDIKLSSFEAIIPYYYFRINHSGYLSNGSYCGNDVESRQVMMTKYIVDMCQRFVEFYDIDGLRFDLMGILDVDLMNKIARNTKRIKSDFLIYGEGWNMPTALGEHEKAMQSNSKKMPDVGFFNDLFRDFIKGKSSENEVYVKGYATGDTNLIKEVESCMLAHSHINYKLYQTPSQSINYVECHDNQTAWDKMKECCKGESNQVRIARQKLMLAMIMTAQGIPFIHSGQEFCRTKAMMHNTYNASDLINQIDWERLIRYKDCYYYFIELVKLRKRFDCLRNNDVDYLDTIKFDMVQGVLIYEVGELIIAFNPTDKPVELSLVGKVSLLFDEFGFVEKARNENMALPISMVVYIKEEKEI